VFNRSLSFFPELSSLLVNMKRDVQVALATPLRSAIWNWIEICPLEFSEALRSRGRMEGAPERVFDLLYSAVQPGSEKTVWPTLTILNCISSERLSMDFQVTNFGAGSGGGSGQKNYRKVNSSLTSLSREFRFDDSFVLLRTIGSSKTSSDTQIPHQNLRS
jgi:hypothetical protein